MIYNKGSPNLNPINEVLVSNMIHKATSVVYLQN
jgi:hypothetical protein